MKTNKDAKSNGTILIADYDFGDINIEQAIIESAGFELRAAQCKNEDEVIEHGREADGILCQYAPIGARAIDAFTRCGVIARYSTGVDIVDVDAATRRRKQVTNAPNEWCAEEVADHAVALWLAATRKIQVRPGGPARRMALADGTPNLAHPRADFRPAILRLNRTQHCRTGKAIGRREEAVRVVSGLPALSPVNPIAA